jgi:WD40 repeat protein
MQQSTMENLNGLLQRCDKNALVGVVKRLCAMFQEKYLDEPEEHDGELDSEDVKTIIHEALFKMQVAEKRQQDKDRNAFTVAVGAGVTVGKPNLQMADAGGRERASTGLMIVGGDALSFIATFLSWEKVKLLREWKTVVSSHFAVQSSHISQRSSMILSSSGHDLHAWDAASGLLKRTFKGHTDSVRSCRFFPDGNSVVSASWDHTLKVWDLKSGSLVRTLVGHATYVMCVDVSPDNTRILSGSHDRTWKLWNSRTGELQHTAEQTSGASYCCAFCPNESFFLVGCRANLVLHDSATYQLQRTFAGHNDTVMSCSFAPDGATILSGSNDRTMKLWSTTTGLCLRTLDGHYGPVRSCSFSSSGHEICSASDDGTLIMWTAATGQLEGIIDADPTTKPSSIYASSAGKYIMSSYDDGTIKMWRVGRGGPVE